MLSMTMADDGFDYPTLLADDGDDADDDKLAMDIESFLSVLDEDRDPSEVRKPGLVRCSFVLALSLSVLRNISPSISQML